MYAIRSYYAMNFDYRLGLCKFGVYKASNWQYTDCSTNLPGDMLAFYEGKGGGKWTQNDHEYFKTVVMMKDNVQNDSYNFV